MSQFYTFYQGKYQYYFSFYKENSNSVLIIVYNLSKSILIYHYLLYTKNGLDDWHAKNFITKEVNDYFCRLLKLRVFS
jgi:hypothetical protein